MNAANKTVFVAMASLLVLAPAAVVLAEAPYQVAWTAQIGTSGDDRSYSVAVDASGNSYISGRTNGILGDSSAGGTDAFLTKFNSSGNEVWSSQIGTSGGDYSYSVAVDASGNSYISGYTSGVLGSSSAGGYDAFLTKFDSSGSELWTQQIGTLSSDKSYSVAVDASGNVYISGSTSGVLGSSYKGNDDAFLTKFDSSGSELWTQQIGTSRWDYSYSVAVDGSGNAYISGSTNGDFGSFDAGGEDAFLTKFDSSGNKLWTKQIGNMSSDDYSLSVAVDASGNAYISGYTDGVLGSSSAGAEDAFLTKLDSSGSEVWTSQIGSSNIDYSFSVAVDGSGNVYISGYTGGVLGDSSAGGTDAFLTKFDSLGNVLWTQQIGTSAWDQSNSVAVDALGNAYISGYTNGDLGGTNAGGSDAFLVKFEPERVTGRHVFYNNCSYDGNNPAAGAEDDGAIATDKTALGPGETANFANYSSYWRGINGIMVDIADMSGVPTAADFEFKVGNDSNPAGWVAAPLPSSITVYGGTGTNGADRVKLIWADNAIENQWLQVTVKATAKTGLVSDDVFYFGSAIGETGNSATDAQVTPADEVGVRNNQATLAVNPASIDDAYDFNRDKKVGPTDQVISRNNGTNSSTALQLITVP